MSITPAIPTLLEEAINRLARGIRAESIYLFGSQAIGQGHPDSDYDLLVIVPQSNIPRHQREAFCYDLLWGLTLPVDVIVLTREEFQQSAQVETSLAHTSKTKGLLLYGKPQD
jgi:predicted nucleotidyltransferase